MYKNCHILCQLLMKHFKDQSLSSKPDEIWNKEYYEGRFHLLDGILYHRTKHTCVMTLKDRTLINTILHECHDSVSSGHLSEDMTLERVKTCSWGPNWRKGVSEYFQTCDRCQKAKKTCRKEIGNYDPNPRTKIPMRKISHGSGNSHTSRRRHEL
ncbi:hypothetical protein O181_082223 [Austropuccinia psidii MF-1]|uniref:Integrase zinc-binding domain-containing protein n=1 Tax=Austropuccinia psidii MF-1 TaxID=1389203 RepID=A0A9Q3FM20_9BASI|nr:hypothetical protein [Austropuccinia psidii MF-1]